jgi:hypothetical protein
MRLSPPQRRLATPSLTTWLSDDEFYAVLQAVRLTASNQLTTGVANQTCATPLLQRLRAFEAA